MQVHTTYTPGIGWQYVLMRDDALIGRYGNFDTEREAMRAGVGALGAALACGATE
jgi:hypothetical protein